MANSSDLYKRLDKLEEYFEEDSDVISDLAYDIQNASDILKSVEKKIEKLERQVKEN